MPRPVFLLDKDESNLIKLGIPFYLLILFYEHQRNTV
jgi:hypothetical protein